MCGNTMEFPFRKILFNFNILFWQMHCKKCLAYHEPVGHFTLLKGSILLENRYHKVPFVTLVFKKQFFCVPHVNHVSDYVLRIWSKPMHNLAVVGGSAMLCYSTFYLIEVSQNNTAFNSMYCSVLCAFLRSVHYHTCMVWTSALVLIYVDQCSSREIM